MSQHTQPRTANTSPTLGVDVERTRFAYREFGPSAGVPVVFLHHFTAVLDDWDPRVIDGIASERHVITFDNRGVGGTGRARPQPSRPWLMTQSPSSVHSASTRST